MVLIFEGIWDEMHLAVCSPIPQSSSLRTSHVNITSLIAVQCRKWRICLFQNEGQSCCSIQSVPQGFLLRPIILAVLLLCLLPTSFTVLKNLSQSSLGEIYILQYIKLLSCFTLIYRFHPCLWCWVKNIFSWPYVLLFFFILMNIIWLQCQIPKHVWINWT